MAEGRGQEARTAPPQAAPPQAAGDGPDSVAPERRAGLLGKDWNRSEDRAWTTSSDADGFHVLVADEKNGYAWRTAASLSEPGLEADQWIGNACVTGSGRRAVVAYAPRTFTNRADLMARGAFTAIVDLDSGAVRKLDRQASLAYFSPGCGTGETAVLTQAGGENKNATRLIKVDAAAGRLSAPLEVAGQVTSAVPVGKDIVAADSARLVRIDDRGRRTAVAATDRIPFQLQPDGDGGVVFMDRPAVTDRTAGPEKTEIKRVTAQDITKGDAARVKPAVLARGPLTGTDLARSATGTVFITGQAEAVGRLPRVVKRPSGAAKEARPSTRGAALITHAADARTKNSREPLAARPVRLDLRALDTGGNVTFEVSPSTVGRRHAPEGRALSPALTPASATSADSGQRMTARATATAGSPNTSIEAERYCSVPRNDPRKQAMQPKPRQVEWAVNQAITANLDRHIARPANWKNLGMPAYRPQSLFPLKPLDGGGRIPAQVMLGIAAQESNMWQAARFVVPGVTGNPLIGNYYGISRTEDGEQIDPWGIDWAKADCGYGVTQVTDGMRMKGREKAGETALDIMRQEAVALDYTANIAAGVNILAEKWNQTRIDGLLVNGGEAKYLENWFFAVWAYNSGYYPKANAAKNGGTWGVGWTNNPANPIWKANRLPFLENARGGDNYFDATHPQDWPYQEKVLGWAARPLEALESPGKMVAGFKPAWWTTPENRTKVKPAQDLFCTAANQCDPGKIGPDDANDPGKGACTRTDFKCWWNQPVAWKKCETGVCGHELLRFDATYDEEDDGTAYAPVCTRKGLPVDALVVDDLPAKTPNPRPGCAPSTSDGSFTFDFAGDGSGKYPSKMDLHQIGAGYNGHFSFSHTRRDGAEGNRLKITGTWTLGRPLNGWARVMVHMPDHGAHTRQAAYVISAKGAPSRVAPQRTSENRWVSLGVFEFAGTARVSLSTITGDGDGSEDVAWDAVAFQPLPAKPRNFVVALGDSYSSGEGASLPNGVDYYSETDTQGGNAKLRNACHRSRHAWSRQAKLADSPKSVGERSDAWDPTMDYHLIACSGATTANVLPDGQKAYGELPQLAQGYVDTNTTLVTISIGGNDALFGEIAKKCVFDGVQSLEACQTNPLGKNTEPLTESEPKLIKGPVKANIVKTIQVINDIAPQAKIVLMGYPILFEKSGSCVTGILDSEAAWINEMGHLMLQAMDEAVTEVRKAEPGLDVRFSNPKEFFKGRGICGDFATVGMHPIVIAKTPGDNPSEPVSAQSFHPNIAGARLYANSLESTLRAMGL